MKRVSVFVAAIALLLGFSIVAHADLIVNTVDSVDGYQLIYDTGLNITWLDYNPGGMTFAQATAWAALLGPGWRLPTSVDVGGPWGTGYDGTTAIGFNITTSELGYLYYIDLGNKGYLDTNGNFQPGYNIVNLAPFTNLLPQGTYWSGTEVAEYPGTVYHFNFDGGGQGTSNVLSTNLVLAVYDGNFSGNVVLPVLPLPTPIPSTILLFAPGLLGLMVVRRRFKK